MVVSIDIGSTWTKGVLLRPEKGLLEAACREQIPTTTEDLSKGFGHVLRALQEKAAAIDPSGGPVPVRCSSSAHGGLKMAAIGVVPGLTLKAARLAALSAGARLTFSRSYSLLEEDLRELERHQPDIILLTGGTDGGNRSFILHNASLLAGSSLAVPLLYAGNRDLRDQVAVLLDSKELYLADNVLPDLQTPRPEQARSRIRDIFLSRIIRGKGLAGVVEASGADPVPTPASLYDFLEMIRLSDRAGDPFCVIDLGGATTDCYSLCPDKLESKTVRKGLAEPDLKRSVEGDLGLRVSAASVLEAEDRGIWEGLEGRGIDPAALEAYVRRVCSQPESLPRNGQERRYDTLLADFCFQNALKRHAGRIREVYSSDGTAYIQEGKDLRAVRKIIGTGGYLAAAADFLPGAFVPRPLLDQDGRRILLPEHYTYQADRGYLLPLLANASREYPEESINTMLALSEGNLWN